ncbi:uncharacterized protein LOC128393438 [Panonychus citri]|uniref:uncharacterized protein LOC128393438 n=1 Tax=Panonychus citri TaxID=50023 RepID=UPI002306F5E1|nr:uncharacterized protein LOC128393438 [Panonychus citri]
MQGDYNRGGYFGSDSQSSGYDGGNYQQPYNPNAVGQSYSPPSPPPQQQQPGFQNQPANPYYGQQQPPSFYNRPAGIAGSPAHSTPSVPSLSEEDIKIFKETQKNVMLNKFLPAALIGCGAIYMAHQKKLFKPSGWTYGIYLCTASYVAQFTTRNELKRRIAESPSMSPFAQQVRMQMGYGNNPGNTFSGDSGDFNFSQGYNQPTTGTQYSPYNRFNRQRQSNSPSEFTDELSLDGKDLTEFSLDSKSIQNKDDTGFVPDDIYANDPGFRTRKVVDQTEKSKLTYEELRNRNRAQYSSSPGNAPYMQPMNNGQPEMYNRTF